MYVRSHGKRSQKKRERERKKSQIRRNLSTQIPINLRSIDKSHMIRFMCHIPFHQGQIPSHLCALGTHCLRLPSITITFLKEQQAGPQLQHMSMGLKNSQGIPFLHLRYKTSLWSFLPLLTSYKELVYMKGNGNITDKEGYQSRALEWRYWGYPHYELTYEKT